MSNWRVVIFFLGLLCSWSSVNTEDVNVRSMTNQIDLLVKTGQETTLLKRMISTLAIPKELQRTDWKSFTGERAKHICIICQAVVKTAITMRRTGASLDTIEGIIIKLCIALNLQTVDVCHGAIELNAPILFYIVDKRPNLTETDICGVILQTKSCTTANSEFEWSVNIASGSAKVIQKERSDRTVKILQITDVHYDPSYEPRGNADCDEPICCRQGQNKTNTSGLTAGYWGDYHYCDTPWHAVTDVLDHIKDVHKNITYIYFTGDIIDHGIWETTKAGNIESLTKSYAELYDTFGDIPVYPIFGNHEPQPANIFAPSYLKNEDFSTEWLYTLMADTWINYGWLPESTRSTILKGGFYTVSPKKGFRIIALNNNVCYTYNWWLLYDPRDPDDQLRWLIDILEKAEESNEYVHILAHIPPGDESCYITWSREYRRIVNRFAHIITGQFNGHTHNDELRIFYDLENNTKPVNVAWNGGSLTTYPSLNPNYKTYDVNANTFEIEDIHTWIYNLTLANENPTQRPQWFESYSFKEQYGLRDLSLNSLNDWVITLSQNSSMLRTYHKNFIKLADPGLQIGCQNTCLKEYLCKIVTSAVDDDSQCKYFTKQ
ncbi:sphingomyelin phosphodiesterase-like [Orussus abietinus]|uniref:sphingomyelin phosphodiesterase-like n=1 Tax=Orussus abietinus TaxID=222816 RepID=UPI000626CCF3|nr:sphingomyelin phosphodiesterase-like [Orussus abietinus]